MKIRGTVTVTRSLILPNPGGSTPREGLVALSDEHGSLKWGDLLVPVLRDVIYPTAGALVLYTGKLYFSVQDNASGSLPLDPLFWTEVGSGTGGGTTLPQNQIDALDASSAPAGSNPFATLSDISNLDIQGSTNVADILLDNASIPNKLWIATDTGIDSYATAVALGDALVSDGSGWYNIGQFRGPIGITGADGEQGPAGGGITLAGSDVIANILLINPTPAGVMWISTDAGLDDLSNAVSAGDGVVSDGVNWLTVGPIRGPQGLQGIPGIGLPAGGSIGDRIRKAAGGDYSTEWFLPQYVFTKTEAAIQWDIAHNLGEYPVIQLVDTLNVIIEGEIEHIDINNTKVTFNVALEGKAYLKI